MRRRALLAGASLVALAFALSGCGGSSKSEVVLTGGTESTGGKAIALSASTDEKLVGEAGQYQLELRGIMLGKDPPSSFDAPDYRVPNPCIVAPCEWTLAPETAGTYEYRAFLLDAKEQKESGESDSVEVAWTPSPQPQDIQLLINGKSLPITALDGGDDYHDIPAGKMHVTANWKGDVAGSGYYVSISTGEPKVHVYARCRTGTSCVVPQLVPIAADQEVTWVLEVKTTQGDKTVTGFKICVAGA